MQIFDYFYYDTTGVLLMKSVFFIYNTMLKDIKSQHKWLCWRNESVELDLLSVLRTELYILNNLYYNISYYK